MTQSAAQRRYGGKSPDERREERRRRLLDAGLDLFGTRGYNPCTVNDVCRAAAVAPVHFYDLYDGRESLLRAVYDDIVTGTQSAVLEAIAARPYDVLDRSRAGLAAFCHHLLADPRRARVQCIEVVGVSRAMELHRRSVIRSYVGLLLSQLREIQQAEGGDDVAGDDPVRLQILATAVAGGVNEAMIDWLLSTDPPPIPVLAHSLGDLLSAVASTVIPKEPE